MSARSRIALLIGAGCIALMVWAVEPLPNLPLLSIDDFPREVREQVQQAYKAASTHPGDSEASGKLAMLLDLYNRPDDAARCYDRAHQLGPQAFKWFYYEGTLRSRQKKQSEAAILFRQALKLDPTYLPARLKYAASLLESANLEESARLYSEILKDHPDAAEAYYGLGRVSNLRGDAAAAVGSLQRAVELFPPYGAAHYALAQANRKLGDGAAAEAQLKLYEANRDLVPPIEDPLRDAMRSVDMAASAHLQWGVELQQVGRVQDAIAETERAAELDPHLVQAQVNLIILYGRLSDVDKAKEHYQKAVALNALQFPDAYYDYGVVLMNAKRFPEAAQAFRQAIEINSSYAEAHNNLGYLLELDGRLEDAASEYRRAIEAKSDFRQAHFNLGRILINKQDFQGGLDQLRQTLSPVDEGTPSYLYALGAAYGRAGSQQQALEYLNRARVQADSYGQKQLLTEIDGDIRRISQATQP